jgi:hypothetical protein
LGFRPGKECSGKESTCGNDALRQVAAPGSVAFGSPFSMAGVLSATDKALWKHQWVSWWFEKRLFVMQN